MIRKIPLFIGWPSQKEKQTLPVYVIAVDFLFYVPPFVCGGSVLRFVLVCITLRSFKFSGTRYIENTGLLFFFYINLPGKTLRTLGDMRSQS